MEGNIGDLKSCLTMDKSLKIGILDNCSIEFLTRVQNKISPEIVFNQYDIVLIPLWVWYEVEDSHNRVNYINELRNKSIRIHIVDEKDYSKMVDFKEAELYYLFLYSCDKIGRLVSFLNRDILKNRPLEELEPYEDWLKVFYEQGLDGDELSNGRIQKKNAGEISISILSYILSYYYTDNISTITVFSDDRDAYELISGANRKFQDNEWFKNRECTSITFKSNDCLIYEWSQMAYIGEGCLESFINNYRQARRIKFTRKKHDNSVEEVDKVIDNKTFVDMLDDMKVHIIF